MKGNYNKGKSDRIGKSDSIGKSDRIGKSDSIGKSDRIGNLDLGFKRVRGRREFFDLVLEYIKSVGEIEDIKLSGYLQYTTGASDNSIKQALAVLESINLIEAIENQNPPFNLRYKFKELTQKLKDLE